MKKIWFVLIFLLIIGSVVAMDEPSTETGEEDVEKIEKMVEDYSPLDEYGDVDIEKYKPIVTKAEMRIDKINLWLEKNASWLKVVFGMVPSITWLFAINLWLLLFFFTILVLNGDVVFAMFDFLGKKIDLIFFEITLRNVFGFILFVLLLVTKIFVNFSIFLAGLMNIFWNYILPWGLVVAVVVAILIAIVFILLLIYAPHVLIKIKKRFDEKRKKKGAEKETVNREILEKIVEGTIKD